MSFFSQAFSEVFGEPPPPGGEEGRGLGVGNVGPDLNPWVPYYVLPWR